MCFLRVQKTGSSTFEKIMVEMAKKYKQTQYSWMHYEFRKATSTAPGCAVTMLRDPLERFMSEFAMARGPEGFLQKQDQWDWHDNDLDFLDQVQSNPNRTESLLAYLRSPNNPTRNRQAMYLLGFDRVACDRRPHYLCSNKHPGYPAHAYDWAKDHDELLARAKEHLVGLRAFGVQDCYASSVGLIATSLGWDPAATTKLANEIHERKQDRGHLLALLQLPNSTAAPSSRRLALAETGLGSWSSGLPSQLQAEIRSVNHVDSELVDFAKQQLYELHGLRC